MRKRILEQVESISLFISLIGGVLLVLFYWK